MPITVTVQNTATQGMNRYQVNALRNVASAMVRGSIRTVADAQRILVWRGSSASNVSLAVKTNKSGNRLSKASYWRRTSAARMEVSQRGGRASGRLARSVGAHTDVGASMIVLQVGAGVPYAKFVEGWPTPPRRHFVPFAVAPDYRRWLYLHGVDVPKNAKGWMAGGPNSSTPFLRPAFQQNAPRMIQDVQAAMNATRP